MVTRENDQPATAEQRLKELGIKLPAPPEPFGTYDDHRMVMAAAVLGLTVPGLRVAGADTVAKTFPDFMDVWASMPGLAP